MQDKHIKERTPTLNDIPDGIPHGYWVKHYPFPNSWYTANYIHGNIYGYSEEYEYNELTDKEYYAR